MKESRAIVLVLTGMLLVSAGTYGFEHVPDFLSGWKVNSYSATLESNGTFYEQYSYHISWDGKYHMLYRSWNTRVDYVPSGECVIPLNMSAKPSRGLIGYSRSYSGEMRTYGGNPDGYLMEKSEKNEVGFYAPAAFRAGDYVLNYSYRIYPTFYYDGSQYLLKFVFKDSGWSYGNIRIKIHDNGTVKEVLAPAFLDVKKEGEYWIIEGYDAYGLSIVVYIVMTSISGMSHAGIKRIENVMDEVNSSIMKDRIGYYLLYYPYVAIKWTIYLFPAFFIAAYVKYGREKKTYGQSRNRITPPVRRKPWVVNLVFGKECEATSWSAYLATLLDLKRQGKISMDSEGIRIIDKDTDDIYEKRVLDIIDKLKDSDGVFRPKAIKEELKTMDYDHPRRRELRELADNLRDDKELLKICPKYLWTPKKIMRKILPIPIVLIVIFAIPMFVFREYAIFSLLIMMSSLFLMFDLVLAYWHPSLLGRWKDGYYKEKLEWDSFAETISDKKFMKENAMQNAPLWEDWLIYATALEKVGMVKKAMEEAGIDVSAIYPDDDYISAVAFIYVGGIASSGGTGGVSGGGFGGGGAGAR